MEKIKEMLDEMKEVIDDFRNVDIAFLRDNIDDDYHYSNLSVFERKIDNIKAKINKEIDDILISVNDDFQDAYDAMCYHQGDSNDEVFVIDRNDVSVIKYGNDSRYCYCPACGKVVYLGADEYHRATVECNNCGKAFLIVEDGTTISLNRKARFGG